MQPSELTLNYYALPPFSRKYLDPKVDIVFKRVFGTRKHITIDFLNAMLPLPAPVVDLEFRPGETRPELRGGRFSIVDVRCRDAGGRHFLVEMQTSRHRRFLERLLFSCCRVYGADLGRGQASWSDIQPVYMLAIADFVLRPNSPNWHHHIFFADAQGKVEDFRAIELVVAELPKYVRPETQHARDIWTRFLLEIDAELDEAPPDLLAYPLVEEALQMVEEDAFDNEERLAYESEILDAYVRREEDLERRQLRAANEELSAKENELSAKLEKAAAKMRQTLAQTARAMQRRNFSEEEIARLLELDPAELRDLLKGEA